MNREPLGASLGPATQAADGHRADAVVDQVETVRREPVKALLVAAAAGALLVALLGLLARSRRSS